MALNSLNALFEDTLRDVYYAEKKLTKALPKMAKKASAEALRSVQLACRRDSGACRPHRKSLRDAGQGASRQKM